MSVVADLPAYKAFIRSAEWAALRDAKFDQVGRRCQECGDIERLEVHHLSYDRFGGNERLADLQVLCHWCHMREHGRAPTGSPASNLDLGAATASARKRKQLEEHQALVILMEKAIRVCERLAVLDGAFDRRKLNQAVRQMRHTQKRSAELVSNL